MTVATVITPFNPSPNANFQFQASLDGNTYNVILTWNVYAQRYYVNIYDLTGVEILSRPLVASPDEANISLTAGYFETTMIYRGSQATFEIPGILIPVVVTVRPPSPPIPPPPPPPPPPPAPLDPYATGVTFAFARERLLSSYSGALYRARRSSDDMEQDIHAGTDGTDAVAIAAFAGSGSAYLVTWYDQSGFSLDMTQATASKQPQIVDAGTVFTNFHPDGIDDALVSSGSTSATVAATVYFTGLPYPGVGTSLPLIFGIAGIKSAIVTYAILGGTNDGIQPALGDARGNSFDDVGLSDAGYTVVYDTTAFTIENQIKLYLFDALKGFHGTGGTPDNNPITAGQLVYASVPAADGNFSQAQLRAVVGYSVAHDLPTVTAINTILEAS